MRDICLLASATWRSNLVGIPSHCYLNDLETKAGSMHTWYICTDSSKFILVYVLQFIILPQTEGILPEVLALFLFWEFTLQWCNAGQDAHQKQKGGGCTETRETTVRVAKISKLICRLRSILASWGCVTSLMSDPVRRTVSLPSRTEWRTWRHHNPPTYVHYTLNAWTTSIEFWTRFHLYNSF